MKIKLEGYEGTYCSGILENFELTADTNDSVYSADVYLTGVKSKRVSVSAGSLEGLMHQACKALFIACERERRILEVKATKKKRKVK